MTNHITLDLKGTCWKDLFAYERDEIFKQIPQLKYDPNHAKYPYAHNQNFEDSRGLMQINLDAHPEYSNIDLFDPEINTQIAYILYSKANNSFKDWTCAHSLGLVNAEIPFYLTLAISIGIVLYLAS